MVIKEYEQRGLLLNVAFVEPTGSADSMGFRGRLALVEGEVGDTGGHRKPPAIVMEQAVLLSSGDRLSLLSGSLDRLQDLPALVEMYKGAFSEKTLAIIYVVNLTRALQVELEGVNFSLIPMREGMVWNELMDAALLEKGEVKKLASGAKVAAVYAGLGKEFRAKGDQVSFEQAMGFTAEIRRVERGAL